MSSIGKLSSFISIDMRRSVLLLSPLRSMPADVSAECAACPPPPAPVIIAGARDRPRQMSPEVTDERVEVRAGAGAGAREQGRGRGRLGRSPTFRLGMA